MTQSQHEAEVMPPITVSDFDYNRLTSLAAMVGARAPDVANVLQSESAGTGKLDLAVSVRKHGAR
jgi:hypothetical protein